MEEYQVGKQIGQGAYAVVKLVLHKPSGPEDLRQRPDEGDPEEEERQAGDQAHGATQSSPYCQGLRSY